MNYRNRGKVNDYRVNFHNSGKIISIEVTCCGRHIGEIRFEDGESKNCPSCGTSHTIKIQHNHFHIRPDRPGAEEKNSVFAEKKAL